jgi:hypothetical protein
MLETTVSLDYLPDDDARGWATGEPFTDDPNAFPEERFPPEPVCFRVTRGQKGTLKVLYSAPALVMTKALAAALQRAGVDNLQLFQAEITQGRTTHDDYQACNVVGLVDAADRSKSALDPDLPWFDRLVLQEQADHWPLLFRLKGAPWQLMVHERVKDFLQAEGFGSLEFTDPSKMSRQT